MRDFCGSTPELCVHSEVLNGVGVDGVGGIFPFVVHHVICLGAWKNQAFQVPLA